MHKFIMLLLSFTLIEPVLAQTSKKKLSVCEESLLDHLRGSEITQVKQKNLAKLSCEGASSADQAITCFKDVSDWVSDSPWEHTYSVAATACNGGSYAGTVRSCINNVYNWVNSENSDHRRLVAATACAKNTDPSIVVDCLNRQFHSINISNEYEKRLKSAKYCQGSRSQKSSPATVAIQDEEEDLPTYVPRKWRCTATNAWDAKGVGYSVDSEEATSIALAQCNASTKKKNCEFSGCRR